MKRSVFTICVIIGILLILPSVMSPTSVSHITRNDEISKTDSTSPSILYIHSDSGTGIIEESKSIDSRVEDYLSTDWQKVIPPEEEISQLNNSIVDSLKLDLESVPFEPAITLSDTRNSSTKEEIDDYQKTSAPSQNYFPGHVWASSFGPNENDVEAVPIVPTLEGHYFPKESYSRIYYRAFLQPGMKLHLRVERDQDTYGRYFRVYFGSTEVFETIIWPGTDSWEGDINIGSYGWYIITMEIYFGGHKDKGWQLRYFHLFDSDGQPYDADAEMFPKKSSSELVYRVPMGPNTRLNIETANLYDPYTRYLYIYVDNRYMTYVYAPGSYEINFADYGYQFSTPGMHEIKFVLYYGGYVDYGKRLKHYWINYEYRNIEVDWMEGYLGSTYYNHEQPSEVFDFVETYYIIHDYRRIEFHPDDALPIVYEIDEDTFKDDYYLGGHFNHSGQSWWSYGLFVHYSEGDWGHASKNQRFIIGDQSSYEAPALLMDARKWVLLHEYGHVEWMNDDMGGMGDVYGGTYLYSNPYYCAYSWEEEHLATVRLVQ